MVSVYYMLLIAMMIANLIALENQHQELARLVSEEITRRRNFYLLLWSMNFALFVLSITCLFT